MRSISMSNIAKNVPKPDCAVCYLAHEDQIHEATLRIHRWFHGQVTRNFQDDVAFVPTELQPEPAVY